MYLCIRPSSYVVRKVDETFLKQVVREKRKNNILWGEGGEGGFVNGRLLSSKQICFDMEREIERFQDCSLNVQ